VPKTDAEHLTSYFTHKQTLVLDQGRYCVSPSKTQKRACLQGAHLQVGISKAESVYLLPKSLILILEDLCINLIL